MQSDPTADDTPQLAARQDGPFGTVLIRRVVGLARTAAARVMIDDVDAVKRGRAGRAPLAF